MNSTVIMAIAAACGSLVGAAASIVTTWITQRTQTVHARREQTLRHSEALYGEFITEASRRVMEALSHSLERPDTIVTLYGITGRINLAFGQIAMLGAYGAIGGIALLIALGLDDLLAGVAVAFAAAAAFSGLWSAAIGGYVIAPLHARHRLGQPILVATIAAAIAMQEFLRLTQGAQERWLTPLFNAPIPLARADTFVVTVAKRGVVP